MSYSSEVLADSPAAYYRMNEASGLIQDSSGNGNHATASFGTPTYAQTGAIEADASDDAILFDGSTERFEIDDDATLDLGDVFTLECWINRSRTGVDEWVIGKGTGAYAMRIIPTNELELTASFVAGIVDSTVTVLDDGWHHLVITKSGATSKLYIDAVDVTGTVSDATCVNTGIVLSIANNGPDGGNDSPTGAVLDEVAVYPTALSQARVLAHFEAAFAEEVVPGYQRLYGPAQLGTVAADLYTVPDGALVELRSVYVNNPTGGEIEYTLSIGNDAGATRFLDQHAVAAGDSHASRRATNHTLAAGEKIQGFSDSASAVIVINGYVEAI